MVDQYVIPVVDGWGVREATSREVARVFTTEEEALVYARDKAEAQHSTVFLRHIDGETEKLESYRPVSEQLEIHSIRIGNKYQPRHND